MEDFEIECSSLSLFVNWIMSICFSLELFKGLWTGGSHVEVPQAIKHITAAVVDLTVD